VYPFTNWHPSRGFYDGTRTRVIAAQIRDMRWAGIDTGIASWWGRRSKENQRLRLLLRVARSTPFRWSLYYEPEAQGDPSVSVISRDIRYIVRKRGSAHSFLRISGRPVIFVYADAGDACSMVRRWKRANHHRAYLVLKVFSGYRDCAAQPDAWHQYAPAVRRDHQGRQSFSVSPGFWLKGETERLARRPAAFNRDVKAMAASKAHFQLVTTYNEWGEGTAVESAREWRTKNHHGKYLTILHRHLT
jgi:hypothetical protein